MSILSLNSFNSIGRDSISMNKMLPMDMAFRNSRSLYNGLTDLVNKVEQKGNENANGIFHVGDVTYDVKIKKDAENKPQVTINRLDGRRAATQISAEKFNKKPINQENSIDEKVDDEDEYIIDIGNHLYEAIFEDFSRLEQEKASSASTSGEIPPPPPQP